MITIRQKTVCNRLLRAMSAADFALIEPHLLLVPSPARLVLIEAAAPISHLYFPEHGFTSITIDGRAGPVEIGMIGREGLVGASPIVLGVDRTPHKAFVQMAGENFRIQASDFQDAMCRSDTMRALLLRYVQAFVVQLSQTVFTNAVCGIESRLARWILMYHDRAGNRDIHIMYEIVRNKWLSVIAFASVWPRGNRFTIAGRLRLSRRGV